MCVFCVFLFLCICEFLWYCMFSVFKSDFMHFWLCFMCFSIIFFLAFLVCFGVFLMCVFIFLRVFFVSWLVNRFPPTPGRKMSLSPEHRPRHLLVQIQIKGHFQEFFLSLSFTTQGGAFVTFIHFSESNVCILMTAGYVWVSIIYDILSRSSDYTLQLSSYGWFEVQSDSRLLSLIDWKDCIHSTERLLSSIWF